MAQSEPVLVVGCGRRMYRDDAAGLIVAEALARELPPLTRVVLTESPAADLPNYLDGVKLLIVADAAGAAHNAAPGTILRIDYGCSPQSIRRRSGIDAHSMGLDGALELGRQLGALPRDVWVYVVAAADTAVGDGLTPAVQASVERLERMIRGDIGAWLASRTHVPRGTADARRAGQLAAGESGNA